MQLLNSNQKTSSNFVLEVLQDITENLQIESNFRITHPHYKAIELPVEELKRIQLAPQNLQDKFLSLQLRNFIYGIYYNGHLRSVLSKKNNDDADLKQKLENNTFLGIDLDFLGQIHENNCGKGYFQPGWRVIKQELDGTLAVKAGNLTLHIDREKHLKQRDKQVSVGDLVDIWTPPNRFQRGFYVATGNLGQKKHSTYQGYFQQLVRIYFHLSPEGVPKIMKSLTQLLNKNQVSFDFKVLYNPSDYNRYDSGVLYFDKSDYKVVWQLLQTIYRKNQSYFRQEVPLFTKFLAPGLALAEEPNHKFSERESFGMNRCQIITDALLETWHREDNPKARMQAILDRFAFVGIDLKHPYINPNSENIYTPVDKNHKTQLIANSNTINYSTNTIRQDLDLAFYRKLGRTDLKVSCLGLGGGGGIKSEDTLYAFERGINFFFFSSDLHHCFYQKMSSALRQLCGRGSSVREKVVLATVTYIKKPEMSFAALYDQFSELGIDYVDIFFWGWIGTEDNLDLANCLQLSPDLKSSSSVYKRTMEKVFNISERLKNMGIARYIGASFHDLNLAQQWLDSPLLDVVMVRHNVAHRAAQEKVFSHLDAREPTRPGIITFKSAGMQTPLWYPPASLPQGCWQPSVPDLYRYSLSQNCVDVCLAGWTQRKEIDAAITGIAQGKLTKAEIDYLNIYGDLHRKKLKIQDVSPKRLMFKT